MGRYGSKFYWLYWSARSTNGLIQPQWRHRNGFYPNTINIHNDLSTSKRTVDFHSWMSSGSLAIVLYLNLGHFPLHKDLLGPLCWNVGPYSIAPCHLTWNPSLFYLHINSAWALDLFEFFCLGYRPDIFSCQKTPFFFPQEPYSNASRVFINQVNVSYLSLSLPDTCNILVCPT